MDTAHHTTARREALLSSARFVVGEAGVDAGALLDPELATDLAEGLSHDVGLEITRRTRDVRTVDELVDGLLAGVTAGARAGRDGHALANVAAERQVDYGRWSRTVSPWLSAIEQAIADAQARGIVRDDIKSETVALVVRDALDRCAKAVILFGHEGYCDAAAALIRSALRA